MPAPNRTPQISTTFYPRPVRSTIDCRQHFLPFNSEEQNAKHNTVARIFILADCNLATVCTSFYSTNPYCDFIYIATSLFLPSFSSVVSIITGLPNSSLPIVLQ